MKAFAKKIFELVVVVILIVSALTSADCTDRSNSEEHSFNQYIQINKEKARVLLQKFHAQMFDCKNYTASLTQPVVMDSTIVSASSRNGFYFLKARIKSSSAGRFYANLKCSQEIFERYKNAADSRALIAASIKRIDESSTVAEADSIDGGIKFLNSGNSIILTGQCLALTEVPEYSHIY